jgi:RHS repeat-associated protein
MKEILKLFTIIGISILLFLTGIALAAEKVYFYHTDPAGTPVAMTDANGNVVWRADYKPFGEEQSITGTLENNKQFIGKEKDAETGLDYFGARYHLDKIGRFISPDPVGPVDSRTSKTNEGLLLNPQLLNRYSYSANNPYRYIDPDGRTVWDLIDFAVFGYDLYKFAKEPSWSKAGDLGLDVVGLLPLVPSLGTIKIVGKGIGKVDEVFEAAKAGKGRIIREKILDIRKNPDEWEKIAEKLDPRQPKGGRSVRELLKNKETGELLERHILEQPTPPRTPHPHYAEPKKEMWGIE